MSNHQPHHCLLNPLFGRRSKKTSKLRLTDRCGGNSPGTGEFPPQMASNAENVSIWWRHHDGLRSYDARVTSPYWTFEWSAQHTDERQTRPWGEALPRTTKELGFYASSWPIAVQESPRHEIKSVNPWVHRPQFFHFKIGFEHLLHICRKSRMLRGVIST